MPEPRPDLCDLSDLPPEQCACRRHRAGTAPGVADVETVGQPFEALYGGVCARCDGPIRRGQQIARCADADDGYAHAGGDGCSR